MGASAAVLVVAQAASAVAAPATTSAASRATTASLAMTTSLAMAPLSAARAAQLSQNVNQHVIVFFKNQPRAAKVGTGAFRTRAGRITAFQQPLMG